VLQEEATVLSGSSFETRRLRRRVSGRGGDRELFIAS
jgi:hypothetical protein